jgi:hypothetical protein
MADKTDKVDSGALARLNLLKVVSLELDLTVGQCLWVAGIPVLPRAERFSISNGRDEQGTKTYSYGVCLYNLGQILDYKPEMEKGLCQRQHRGASSAVDVDDNRMFGQSTPREP